MVNDQKKKLPWRFHDWGVGLLLSVISLGIIFLIARYRVPLWWLVPIALLAVFPFTYLAFALKRVKLNYLFELSRQSGGWEINMTFLGFRRLVKQVKKQVDLTKSPKLFQSNVFREVVKKIDEGAEYALETYDIPSKEIFYFNTHLTPPSLLNIMKESEEIRVAGSQPQWMHKIFLLMFCTIGFGPLIGVYAWKKLKGKRYYKITFTYEMSFMLRRLPEYREYL